MGGSTSPTWTAPTAHTSTTTRITETVLQAGDHIRMGNQIFKFLSADNVEAQYHEAVFQMMTTDGLTGAYNKRYLIDVLARELAPQPAPCPGFVADDDRHRPFQENQRSLWPPGRRRSYAAALRTRPSRCYAAKKCLARYGGEEFAVVMTDTPLAEAAQVAERLRAAVASEPFATGEAAIEVTVSIGIADTRGEDHFSPMHLIQQADQKLYEAKRSGRNRVRT